MAEERNRKKKELETAEGNGNEEKEKEVEKKMMEILFVNVFPLQFVMSFTGTKG